MADHAHIVTCYDYTMTVQKHTASKQDTNYQHQFWVLSAKALPHHSLLVISKRLGARAAIRFLSQSPQRHLSKARLKEYSSAEIEKYTAVIKHTALWHGTGRFQHGKNKTLDILDAIIQADSLTPASDAYAVFVGGDEMVSISTTPLRIIARSYADTHGKGESEPNRYGSALWWVSYYYSLFYGESFTRYAPLMLRNWHKWRTATADTSGKRLWGKKVRKEAYSVWDVFGSGSDIPGNYPILFGIARYGASVKLPKVMAKTEVRLEDPVRFADLSHIEVPEEKVAEVRSLLMRFGLKVPVFAIELGEYVASQQGFAATLGITEG